MELKLNTSDKKKIEAVARIIGLLDGAAKLACSLSKSKHGKYYKFRVWKSSKDALHISDSGDVCGDADDLLVEVTGSNWDTMLKISNSFAGGHGVYVDAASNAHIWHCA